MDKIKSAADAYIPFLIGLAILHYGYDYDITFGLVVVCIIGNLSYLVLKALITYNNRVAQRTAQREAQRSRR